MTSKVIEGYKSSSFLSYFYLLPNAFIYESILIKIYINANIVNIEIFDASLMHPPPNCVDLSLSHTLSFSLFLSKSSPLIAHNANIQTFLSLLFLQLHILRDFSDIFIQIKHCSWNKEQDEPCYQTCTLNREFMIQINRRQNE